MRFTLAFAAQVASVLAFSQLEVRTTPQASIHSYAGRPVIYTQDNNPDGNSILAAYVNPNGTLSAATKTPTNGTGHVILTIPSQNSVLVRCNYLFTINAGSNTLSLFKIDPRDPTNIKLLGAPIDTLGEIPISVTYSEALQTACVANGGSTTIGASCFSVHPTEGLAHLGGLRGIPQPDLPALLPGEGVDVLTKDIVFAPDSSAVFMSWNNATSANGSAGFITAWPVVNGRVAEHRSVTSLTYDIFEPFSINFLADDQKRMVLTNGIPGHPGSSMLEMLPNLTVQSIPSKTNITILPTVNGTITNSGTCWVAYTPKYDVYFLMDVIRPLFFTVDANTNEFLLETQYESPAYGGSDNVVVGDHLYHLTLPYDGPLTGYIGSPQINVWDITPVAESPRQSPKMIQQLDIFGSFGFGYSIQGIAVYPFIPSQH